MAIQYDESGFLIGERRLKELNKGMDNVHADTSEILNLLKGMLGEGAKQQEKALWHTNKISEAVSLISKAKPTINVTVSGDALLRATRRTNTPTSIQTPSQSGTSRTRDTSSSRAEGSNTSSNSTKKPSTESKTKTVSTTAQNGRDSRGRFTASANGINEKSVLDSVKRGFDKIGNLGGADVSNVDPTLDAARELTQLFSPAKNAFKFMGRGAMWLFKKAKPKRSEDLPRAQQDHNTEVERHDSETRKLLRKLIDAVNRQKNGGGLFGGLPIPFGRNGRNGRNAPGPTNNNKKKGGNNPVPIPAGGGGNNPPKPKGGKIAKILGGVGRKLPLVGALVGGGMLASQWGGMSNAEKGGGIGSMIGGGIGGLGGALLGPVGAVAGATIGSVIGDSIGQKVGQWTGDLQNQDVGGAIVKGWNSTLDGIDKMVKGTWAGVSKYGSGLASVGAFGMGGMMLASYGRRGNSSGGASGGYSGGSSGGTPSNYNPNNEVPIKRVLEAGKGYNVVELADGSVIRQDGNWNWRNRNAGNIEDGDFAKASGRVDQSDASGSKSTKRFATFPTFAAGRQAKKRLIFEGKNYRDLDLMGAIARYAPKKENNTEAYQQHVLKAVGANKRMSDYSASERETIMNAIQQKEGNVKTGKVTVIKPATTPQQTGQPSKQPKAMIVNATPARTEGKQMYVSSPAKPTRIGEFEPPRILRRESSQQQTQQPAMMASSNTISQNPADRDIAHALTGGLGMRSQIA